MRVLVIDDDIAIREMLMSLMEDEGHSVVGASDGQEGLEYLQATAELPQLILLDLMMPRLDGWGFYTTIQAEPSLAEIPVIVLSARPDGSQQASRLGSVRFVSKPVDLGHLLTLIEHFEAT